MLCKSAADVEFLPKSGLSQKAPSEHLVDFVVFLPIAKKNVQIINFQGLNTREFNINWDQQGHLIKRS